MAAKALEKSAPETKDVKSAEAAKLAATRERELESAISSITKAYGDGAIMRLGGFRRHKFFFRWNFQFRFATGRR